jgi:hypothetical protein
LTGSAAATTPDNGRARSDVTTNSLTGLNSDGNPATTAATAATAAATAIAAQDVAKLSHPAASEATNAASATAINVTHGYAGRIELGPIGRARHERSFTQIEVEPPFTARHPRPHRAARAAGSSAGCHITLKAATITGTCFFCFQPLLKLFVGNIAGVVSETLVAPRLLVAMEALHTQRILSHRC